MLCPCSLTGGHPWGNLWGCSSTSALWTQAALPKQLIKRALRPANYTSRSGNNSVRTEFGTGGFRCGSVRKNPPGSSAGHSHFTSFTPMTSGPQEAPVGQWSSPISSDLITSKTLKLSSPSYDEHGRLFWIEAKPSEAGRQVLVVRDLEGCITDVTPGPESGFNVCTRVHEYGGGDYLVAESVVYFSNFKDQRVYSQKVPLSGAPEPPVPVTAEGLGLRFADYAWDSVRRRLLAVAEKHDESNSAAVENSLVAIDVQSGDLTTLASGHDFFSSPLPSPGDGSRLCWVAWDFPNMPWDGTQLYTADVNADGSISNTTSVAGGADESVQQPVWSPDGRSLYFISDRSGWWNIYHLKDGKVSAVHPAAAEFGFPMWQFGWQTYQVFPGGQVLALFSDPQEAGAKLGLISPGGAGLSQLDLPYSSFAKPSRLAARLQPGGELSLAVTGGGPLQFSQVAVLEGVQLEQLPGVGAAAWSLVRASADLQLDPGYLSVPQSMSVETDSGVTYLLFYPPANKDYVLPPGELPPLMVLSHGGPTSSADVTLNLNIQYLTSRGFAVANVDYGGSTGYGREYRNKLRGNWGVVDVADCSNAAVHLAKQGFADSKRLCISGGSAGGFTTLACLAFTDVFAAGASLYGVADLGLLAKDTHKFESRYLDLLVGPYPERKDVYDARSPMSHADCFTAPIIFFQGDEDAVVPPEQAIQMHSAVCTRGLPTALLMFPGEQHGFRQARSIRMSLDGMLYFLAKVLGFPATMPDDLGVFPIDNLEL